jgi:hypothetical protein
MVVKIAVLRDSKFKVLLLIETDAAATEIGLNARFIQKLEIPVANSS